MIIVDAFAEALVRRESWIESVLVYRAYTDSLYTRLVEVLADMGLGRAKVGFEKDCLSALHWNEIQQKLPGLDMVDCSRTMDEVRWIKTPEEVVLQKQAADLLDEVYLDVFPTVRPGDTERHVHARLTAGCLEKGFGFVHGILNSSANDVMYGGESDLVFRTGDFVRNDYVAYLRGYAGHQSRLAILGPPTSEQQRGYDATLAVHLKAIDQCRPGRSAGEIYDFVAAEFGRTGVEYRASLVGHGMGPWFHQQEPVLRRGSDVLLEEGMMLAVEPQRQHWHIQDLVLI